MLAVCRSSFALFLLLPALAFAHGHNHAEKPDYYEKIYDATVLGKTGDAYFQEINSGWQGNIRTLARDLDPSRNYVILHVIEPDFVYDLRGADLFRKSILAIGLKKLTNRNIGVGHAFLSWRCHANGQAFEGTTGFTGELSGQFSDLMMGGYGLAAFYSQFSDGHLQTPRLLDFEFDFGESVHSVAVEVSDEVCGRTMGFVRAFVSQPSKPYHIFGPNLDPLRFQGGGCGSFAVSTLTTAGFFGGPEIPEHLWRTMRTNRDLFGYGLAVPKDTLPYFVENEGRKSVSLVKLFATPWDDGDGTGPFVRQQDPELYLLFLKTLYRLNWEELRASNPAQWSQFRDRPEYRYRQLKLAGELTDIDGALDDESHQLLQLTKDWNARLKQAGYHARLSHIGIKKTFTAVILDRR